MIILWVIHEFLKGFRAVQQYYFRKGKRTFILATPTLRPASDLKFKSFYNSYHLFYPNKPKIEKKWLEWFIGFSEGDGSLLTYKRPKQNVVRFVISQKEKNILDHIQQTLGFGVVRYITNGKYYQYIVEDYKNVFILANIFNGNLVIKRRIVQLKDWINILNLSILKPGGILCKSGIKQTVILGDVQATFGLKDA